MKKFYPLMAFLLASISAISQIPIPSPPLPGSTTNCTSSTGIDQCLPGSNFVVSTHTNGAYNRGNSGNNLGVNAVWRYRNMAVVDGITINAEVTVDAISNATLVSIDDDAATDHAGVSIASFFAPRISPDQNLNGADRRGYVQFTMRFFKNASGVNNNTNTDFATPVNLGNINYVHYDIDGNDAGNTTSGTPGSWFRETGVAQKLSPVDPVVLANSVTELVPYNYTDALINWTGFVGSVYERTGVSRCAQVVSSFYYKQSQPSVTFRMGYDYNAGNNVGRPTRQYGSRFGCYNFPSLTTLPVTLQNFSGNLLNDRSLLKWTTESEVNFQKFVIERSIDGKEFSTTGEVNGRGIPGRHRYEFEDDLAPVSGSFFYYRLKMIDIDGKFSYSPTLVINRVSKKENEIVLYPNPVTGGSATLRIPAFRTAMARIHILDLRGKEIFQHDVTVHPGINHIPLPGFSRLQPGTYIASVITEGLSSATKFSVTD